MRYAPAVGESCSAVFASSLLIAEKSPARNLHEAKDLASPHASRSSEKNQPVPGRLGAASTLPTIRRAS